MSKPVIGVVGLGIMGSAMAEALIKCGYAVVGYDVSAPACKRLKAAGGKSLASAKPEGPRLDGVLQRQQCGVQAC
jgi:3-hydroxyisobutyrate dehydrogenase-like beta-hydroxyacid dehydrogenase